MGGRGSDSGEKPDDSLEDTVTGGSGAANDNTVYNVNGGSATSGAGASAGGGEKPGPKPKPKPKIKP